MNDSYKLSPSDFAYLWEECKHCYYQKVNPEEMKLIDGKIVFTTTPTWHSVEEDMDEFISMILEIEKVLDGDLPNPSEECNLCKYRAYFNRSQLHIADDLPF